MVYSYPLAEGELSKVVAAFADAYTEPKVPSGYTATYSATQFQARKMDGEAEIVTTGIFGPYAPDQAKGLFQTRAQMDENWALALIYDRVCQQETGFQNHKTIIRESLRAADDESWQLLGPTIVNVVERA
jgi:hypothetical protein